MSTINAASASRADITTAVGLAVDGDTVVLPVGTGHFTDRIIVDKSITIQGQTTISPTGVPTDLTVLYDDITTGSVPTFTALFVLSASTGQKIRITGVTFLGGTGGAGMNDGAIDAYGPQDVNWGPRVDHCHFYGLRRRCLYIGVMYGVIDHNVFDYDINSPFTQTLTVKMEQWNGDTNGTGDKSFADYPWFGTGKFPFIENNWFNNNGGTIERQLWGTTDGDIGGRWVIRYNHFYNITIQSHGTENRSRGVRCVEIYNNDFRYDYSAPFGGSRTGTALIHDNTFIDSEPTGWGFGDLRNSFYYPTEFWGANGLNPWDLNATESDGTHVDGHASYEFYSGTSDAGSSTTTQPAETILNVTGSPGWSTNQWAGYVATKADGTFMYITSNDSDTLRSNTPVGGYVVRPTWAEGTTFKIYKVVTSLDQPAQGRGDLIQGGYQQGGATLNTVTGTAAYPHAALEPFYSWNNIHSPSGHSLGFYESEAGYLQEGRDYYNNSASAAVVAKYDAALNGTQYAGPYTYPHPFITAGDVVPSGRPLSSARKMAGLGRRIQC